MSKQVSTRETHSASERQIVHSRVYLHRLPPMIRHFVLLIPSSWRTAQYGPRWVLPLPRAARTPQGQVAWCNQAGDGGMVCRIDTACHLADRNSRSSGGVLSKPVGVHTAAGVFPITFCVRSMGLPKTLCLVINLITACLPNYDPRAGGKKG